MKKLLVAVALVAAVVTAEGARVHVRGELGVRSEQLGVAKGGVRLSRPTVNAKTAVATSAKEPDAAATVAALSEKLGVTVQADELKVIRSITDRFGRTHVRLQQLYKGVEVDGRVLIVHYEADGRVYEVNGEFLDGIEVDTSKRRDAASPCAKLVIYARHDNAAEARLCWKVRVGKRDVFTDAATGEVVHTRRVAPHALAETEGEPQGEQEEEDAGMDDLVILATESALPEGNAVTVTGNLPDQQGGAEIAVNATEAADGTVYLAATREDGIEVGVLDGIAAPKFRDALRQAVGEDRQDAWLAGEFLSGTYWTAYSTDEDEDMPNALAIACNINTVLDYYKAAFSRSSYDGLGGRVAAWRFWQEEEEDIDSGYANAFWASMADGAAQTNGCFFFGYDLTGKRSETSLDTCGHELTHGITSWTANLQYEGESGALNESFSDLIGMGVEFWAQPRAEDVSEYEPGKADWLFDEDSGEAARSLIDPQVYEQPSRYQGKYWADTSDTSEDNDNGGVHINSGVQNHFFYLLSEGGKGTNNGIAYDLKGIGIEKAVQIAYDVLTAYCDERTDYAAVTSLWDSAALKLVESGVLTQEDYAAIAPAWAAVMSAMPFDAAGENVYALLADDDTLLVRTGKVNARGVCSVKVSLVLNGRKYNLSGRFNAADAAVTLTNRKLGTVALAFDSDNATVSITTADGDEIPPLTAPRVSPVLKEFDPLDSLNVGVGVTVGSEDDGILVADIAPSLVRYSAKGLPAGVKIDAKTGVISGSPRRAGSGTATITARCTFAVPGQSRAVTAKVARTLEWKVAALDAYAIGKFKGDGVALSIGKTGRISGKVTADDGARIRIAAKSYSLVQDGAYAAVGEVRDGSSFYLEVTDTGLTLTLYRNGAQSLFTASRF